MELRVLTADPLNVLGSTLPVVLTARQVRIDTAAVELIAAQIPALDAASETWEDDLHFRDGTWRTAGWVLALDALNFCFWSDDPDRRWRVAYGGTVYDGYWALAGALRRAVDEGVALWDAETLSHLTPDAVRHMLRPVDADTPEIPLFEKRVEHLNELGQGLLAFSRMRASPDGHDEPAALFVASANRSAATLVEQAVTWVPSFDDVASLGGNEVRFYKRAQILAADLAGAFGGEGLGAFDDLPVLTAFADYKVPQVLRRLGALVYEENLAGRIDRREHLPAGSAEEIEIRAATIWACELIRQALAARGETRTAVAIDWALWQLGQRPDPDDRPYHRTRTPYY
jgi:hypothetical protein